jgi:hypothetical protein
MGDALTVSVECYSGAAYAERPVAISFGSERWLIEQVLRAERTPQGKHFKAVLVDGREVALEYFEHEDLWKVTGLV